MKIHTKLDNDNNSEKHYEKSTDMMSITSLFNSREFP